MKKENNRFNAEIVVAHYRFGTWNIGTLKAKSGEFCEVLCRRKVKVCCIQEARWKGEGSRGMQSTSDVGRNDAVQYIRRRSGEEYNSACLVSTVKHPQSVMVWGCFSWHGIGRLHLI